MGTCYSKSGHEVDPSMKENRPKEKKGSSKNGHVKAKNRPTLIIDQIQKDVSDTVYTEDSHTVNALDIENCINKSQQTSLDHLARDLNKNPEVIENTCSDTVKLRCNNFEKVEQDKSDKRTNGLEADPSGDGDEQVVASDSGIVVETNVALGSEHIEDKQDIGDAAANDLYSEKFEFSVGEQRPTNTDTESHNKDLITEKPFQNMNKVQSPLISRLRQSGEIKCHNGHPSNVCCNGECHDSLLHVSSNCLSHGTIEPRVMKSSLKKIGSRSRRKKGLSWKSSDSLDWVIDSMTTTLDRTKSVCSSVFGDDISMLNAPLAAFDSVDFAIGDSYDFSKHFGEKLRKPVPVEYCSDSMHLKFDFSGLEGENRRSISSLDRLSESHKSLDSTTDLDKIKLVLRQSSVSSTDQRFSTDQVDTSYDLPCLSHQPEITTMTMNGREVVVIDAELFSQITDEIQFLKMKLSQLTEVIQESEAAETPRPGRSTPLSSVSSVS